MTKIIKSASETREYLIQELKKQLVGPGMSSFEYYSQGKYNHSNEILDKSPRSVYTAGILFPQGEVNSYHFDEDDQKENTLDENNIPENKDNSPKASQDDIEEEVSDNNFDLDLTNELRASAMGMTILISNDRPIIIGVNDIGRYNKLGKEPSKQLLMACCYLSKYENSYQWLFEKFKLPKNTQDECHKFLENIYSVSNIKVNFRDYFDPHFETNKRVGFDKEKVPTHISRTIKELEKVKREELEMLIENDINSIKENKKEIEEVKSGYQRESINSIIEIQSYELNNSSKRIIKNLKDEKNKKIGLCISVIIRPHKDQDKKYLTVSLVNTNLASKEKILVNKCFFQSNFFIHAKKSSDNIFHSFDQINIDKLSQEEKSLNLLHHNRKSYAIGRLYHLGEKPDGQFIIKSETIPVFETKPIQARI